MDDSVEYRHLKYFLAIADAKGFRAAAEALYTSQPSLTKQMKDLEAALGIRLIDRSGNRMGLTTAGSAFVTIARELLLSRREAFEAIRAIDHDLVHRLRLGYSSFVGLDLFEAACDLQRKMDAQAAICARSEDMIDLIEEVAEGTLDAALVMLPIEDDRLCVQVIRQERLLVCLRADDPLSVRRALTADDIRDKLTIFRVPSQHPLAHARLVEMLAEIDVLARVCCLTSSSAELQTFVKEGFGYGLIREGAALQPDLTTRPIAGVGWTVDSAIIYSKASERKFLPLLARNLRRQFERRPSASIYPLRAKQLPLLG
jgi:DNA-binding transcriptional LysR family regulator